MALAEIEAKKKTRFIIIEDQSKVAQKIGEVLKQELESKLQDRDIEIVLVKTKEDFDKLELSSIDKFVIDLNLDRIKKEGEGIEILQEINNKGFIKSRPIIYTGSANENYLKRCIDLGIEENRFLTKGILEEDFPRIINLFYNDLLEAPDGLFTSGISELNQPPSASKKNPTTRPKLGYLVDNQKLKKNKALDIRNKILDGDVEGNKGDIQEPEVDLMNIEAQHISILSDINRSYKKMSQNARIALCKFFLEPFHEGSNTFGVEGKLFKAYMQKGSKRSDSDQKNYLNLDLNINRNNRQLEKLSWGSNEENLVMVDFSTLEAINEYFKIPTEKTAQASEFINDLIELFAAKRLAELYKNANHPKEKIVDLAASLNKGLGGLSFITNIWEYLTQEITEDAEETIELLKDLKEKGFPEIEEAFYCKITEVDSKEEVVDTEIFSLEDNSNIFPRSFDLKLLKDAGLETVDACFKLLVVTTSSSRKEIGGRRFFIEPLPLSAYYRRQTF